jgi:serine/threonine protein kinase
MSVKYHTCVIGNEGFNIDKRYKMQEFLGCGSYGLVGSATNLTNRKMFAIKKSKNIFQSRTLAKRTLREIRLLRLIKHENIVKIIEVLRPMDIFNFNDIYTVFEYMETDLGHIIKSNQVLKADHIKYFMYQIFQGLEYLHHASIIHRDLK